MLGFLRYRFLPVLLFICACPDDGTVPGPLDTDTASETGPTGGATDELTVGSSATTMGPTDPDTTPTTSDTEDVATAGSGGGDVSSTFDPPAACGPSCDSFSSHEGMVMLTGAGANFACVNHIVGDLYIGANAGLQEIASLGNLERVEGTVTIAGNLELADLSGLACLREVEALKLTSMPQLDDLHALANLRVAPHLEFERLGITGLPTFAPDFAGVSSLILRDNDALVDLHAAATWGVAAAPLELHIEGNAVLPGISGLGGLLADNGANKVLIELLDLPKLASLTGLEPVVQADLHFQRLPKVPGFAPLANLVSGGQLTFNALPAVGDLEGLGALASVGTFTIGDCSHGDDGGMDGLTSLVGLDSLVSVGHFALAGNDHLASLAGAPQLSQIDGFSSVGNPALSQSDYDTFFNQLEGVPWGCVGSWGRCECFPINPG
ncbi:hypothetical protein [Nannocystis punicea]|uniref:Receptor L domain-containing protein n=1 Tax=Nannocystis punicea TaxID=2995304 RepID=A0ABY7HD73_9BACT|nr:hypothetical protein [Nannocystis poenicansa]WAS97141.1 hypothetical protein O0S08_13415 [Nannocystis poenicansa]